MESMKKVESTGTDSMKPFGNKDRIGYMLGDLGNGILFSFISSYLLLFYTDVFGISAAAVGTMMVVARVWDAINDPMMGVIVDKKKPGKGGKFRPFILYGSIPLAIFAILTFTSLPGLSENLKLVYAYVTYIGFGMAYTAVNIPYGSLSSVMTSDPVERTSLSTFRTIGSMLANLILMILTPMLIFNAEGTVSAEGFMKAAIIYAVISTVCCFFTYRLTTERVVRTETQKADGPKIGLLGTIKMLFKNRALIGIMFASLGMLLALMLPMSLNSYLFKDYFQNPGLLTIAGLVGIAASFVIMPFTGKFVSKFGKKETAAGTLVISIVSYLILFFFPVSNPYVYMAIFFVSSLGAGFFNILTWALVGDAIDYQEYITGKREEGIVYASYSLVRKLVQALIGGLGGFSLAMIGYQSGAASQAPEVAEGIMKLCTGIPLVGYIIGFISLVFIYDLSKDKLAKVQDELAKRR